MLSPWNRSYGNREGQRPRSGASQQAHGHRRRGRYARPNLHRGARRPAQCTGHHHRVPGRWKRRLGRSGNAGPSPPRTGIPSKPSRSPPRTTPTARHETVQISHVASGTYADLSIDSLTVQIKDDETLVQGTSARPLTARRPRATPPATRLRLNEWPRRRQPPVTVHIEPGPKVQTVPEEVQFTQSNWNQRPDNTSHQDRSGGCQRRSTSASRSGTSRAKAKEIGAGPVIVTIIDDDETGVALDSQVLELAEGEEVEYRVWLTAAPLEPITLPITGMENTSVAVSPTNLEFNSSNWNQRQTVSVEAMQDTDFADEVRDPAPRGAVELLLAGRHRPSKCTSTTTRKPTGPVQEPPNDATVWWGTMRIGDGRPDTDLRLSARKSALGTCPITEFEYAGATRSIEALYYSAGTVHLWMYMGSADALPNSMELAHRHRRAPSSTARSTSISPTAHSPAASIGTAGPQANTKSTGPPKQPSRDLARRTGRDGTARRAHRPHGNAGTRWHTPRLAGPGHRGRADPGVRVPSNATAPPRSGQYWWSTESTATTYTVKPLSAGRRVSFRVRAVNADGNGAESQATPGGATPWRSTTLPPESPE